MVPLWLLAHVERPAKQRPVLRCCLVALLSGSGVVPRAFVRSRRTPEEVQYGTIRLVDERFSVFRESARFHRRVQPSVLRKTTWRLFKQISDSSKRPVNGTLGRRAAASIGIQR